MTVILLTSIFVTGCGSATIASFESTKTAASASARPTAGPSAEGSATNGAGFTTPGLTSGWTRFSWQQVPEGSVVRRLDSPYATRDLVGWAHGYAAIGATEAGDDALITSPDGETWTQMTPVSDPNYVAAGSDGLVVVAANSSQDTIWTSLDGRQWRKVGPPSGISQIQSIAGNAAGLVATGMVTYDRFGLAFSSDGVSWTPSTSKNDLASNSLGVYSNGARFFVIGGSSATGQGSMWWSDDGRTWTRAAWNGFRLGCLSSMRSPGSGMISWTTQGIATDAVEMEVSQDGGKTWFKDSKFGPLGSTGTCPDACVSDGSIYSNGSILLALNDEGAAWTSSPTACPGTMHRGHGAGATSSSFCRVACWLASQGPAVATFPAKRSTTVPPGSGLRVR